jgi:thermitase
MKWNFRARNREVSYNVVKTALAVRPNKGLRRYALSAEETQEFGRAARDASPQGHFGQALLPGTLEIFAGAGWIFVEPQEPLSLAAAERSSVPGAEAVRHAVIDQAGELLIATGLVTVQLPEDLSEGEALRVLKEDGLTPVGRLGFAPNLFEARVSARGHLHEVVGELQSKTDRYHFVCPEMLQIFTGRATPTDPDFPEQWQHNGIAGIRSEAAWDKTRGAGVRIALIDTGMQIDHPDLAGGIKSGGHFKNKGAERADFIPLKPGATDFPTHPHGTFCLGMAGARADFSGQANGLGGCGSAPEADLIAIACLKDQVGTQATLARAIAFAANPSIEDSSASPNDGADVISCSLGPKGRGWLITDALDLAIKDAATKGRGGLGVPIFWAVDDRNIPISFDQVCSHPNVIAVGRSDITNNTDSDSNHPFAFGPKLELLAPGVRVFSTVEDETDLDFDTGTSFAAPLAAGVAALVLSLDHTLTAEQVRARLRETCDQIGNVVYDANGHNDRFGYGRINAGKAVQ